MRVDRLRLLKSLLVLVLINTSLNALSINDLLTDPKYEGSEETNPSQADIEKYIDEVIINLSFREGVDIPPIIFKAIVQEESLFNHYTKEKNSDRYTIHYGTDKNKKTGKIKSYGLGLSQLTFKIDENGDFFDSDISEIETIVTDWKENIRYGILVLYAKWKINTKNFDGIDTNGKIIENWYYPIAWYNQELPISKVYVDKIYEIMREKIPDIAKPFEGIANPNYSGGYTLREFVIGNKKLHLWDLIDPKTKKYQYKEYHVNFCQENYDKEGNEFSPVDSELGKIHEWSEGTNLWLQDCIDRHEQKKLIFWFDNQPTTILLELGFLEGYTKNNNNFGINNLGRPIFDAVDFINVIDITLNESTMKLTSCQEFENGLLLWDNTEGVSDSKYILHPDAECSKTFVENNQIRISSNFNIEQHFTDVPPSHLNYQAINFVKDKGIVIGYENGTVYKPDNPINRAEFLKILLLAKYSQSEIDAAKDQDFSDIEDGFWYKNFANFAKQKNIIKGYEDGTFGGSNNITFAEAAKIVVNVLIEKTDPTPGTQWWNSFYQKLEENGVKTYNATHNITRGEMAQMIYEVMN